MNRNNGYKVSYLIIQGERRGSLAFVRSDSDANVNFKKMFGTNISEIMPEGMCHVSDTESDDTPVSSVP